MKINSIQLHNFFNHRDITIDFDPHESPVLITGKNGAGKTSSILEALTWAIFAETRLQSADDAINLNADEMSVTIDLELNNQSLVLTRSKKRGKTPKLMLTIDGHHVEELYTETQARISKLFNLSYDAFLSSIILRQDDVDGKFIKSKPEDRRRIIAEILDLRQYEMYEKSARDQRALTKTDIKSEEGILANLIVVDFDELASDLDTVSKMLTTLKIKLGNAQKSHDDAVKFNLLIEREEASYQESLRRKEQLSNKELTLQKNITAKTEETMGLKKFIKNFKDMKSFLLEATDAISNIESHIGKLRTEIQSIDASLVATKQSKLDEVEPLYMQVRENLSLRESKIKELRSQLNKLETLGEAECSECLQPISKQHLASKRIALLNYLEQHEEPLSILHQTIDGYKLQLSNIKNGEFKEYKNLYNEQQQLKIRLQDADLNLKKAKQIYNEKLGKQQEFIAAHERLGMLEEQLPEYESELQSLRTELSSLKIEKPSSQRKEVSSLKNELNKAKTEHEEGIRAQNTLQITLERAKVDQIKRESLLTSVKEKKHRLELLEKLCVAFSHHGIPNLIISTVLPDIEKTANEFLSRISENLQVEFQTTKQLKNGEETDTLDIAVHDGAALRNYDGFSGGEKFRISLAIRLALSKILTNRAGVELRTLILDEAATNLDIEGRESFAHTLKNLNGVFDRILIITHLPDLAQHFDNRLRIGA